MTKSLRLSAIIVIQVVPNMYTTVVLLLLYHMIVEVTLAVVVFWVLSALYASPI